MAIRKVNGAAIRERRKSLAIRQADLAEHAGITAAYLSQIESGLRTQPSPDVVLRLASGLGVRLDEIILAEAAS